MWRSSARLTRRPGSFLSQTIHREFVDASSEPGSTMICAFTENGKIVMEYQNRRTGETDERRAMVDPTPNWDRYPAFGIYEDLLRKERGPSGRPLKPATKRRTTKRAPADALARLPFDRALPPANHEGDRPKGIRCLTGLNRRAMTWILHDRR